MKISRTSSLMGIFNQGQVLHLPQTNYNSTLIEARKLILSMYVHLILEYNIYEYRHA